MQSISPTTAPETSAYSPCFAEASYSVDPRYRSIEEEMEGKGRKVEAEYHQSALPCFLTVE
jgi:hypothetical protein